MVRTKQMPLDGDADLARFLIERMRLEHGVAPVAVAGQLYRFDGRLWRSFDDVMLKLYAQSLHRHRGLKMSLHLTESATKLVKLLCESRGFFASAPKGVVVGDQFVAAIGNRGTSGGTSLPFSLSPVGSDHKATYGYGFKWTTKAPKKFLAFLKDVWLYDDDQQAKVALLASFIGACILGTVTQYERALIFWGPKGDNGKSVLIEVIERLFDEEHRSCIPPQLWSQEYYRHALMRSHINLLGELPKTDIADSEAFKAIISGNAITGRQLREEVQQYKPIAGHIWAANKMPVVTSPDDGFWKRFLILGFNRRFDARVPRHQLLEPLFAEVDQIACWAIRAGCELYRRGHYLVPQSCEQLKLKWKMRADQVMGFLEDCAVGGLKTAIVPNGHIIGADDCYQMYKHWAFRAGHTGRLSKPNFIERMSFLGIETVNSAYLFEMKDESEWGS